MVEGTCFENKQRGNLFESSNLSISARNWNLNFRQKYGRREGCKDATLLYMNFKKYPYWYAFLFYVIINLIGGYSVTLFVNIKDAYDTLMLPSWAPATWVFGFAWTINNILVIMGNVWALQSPASRARMILVRLQTLSWINYAIFQWLSFGTGIASMYFWPTASMLVLTLASIYYAYKIDVANKNFTPTLQKFRPISLTFSTLLVWLVVASTLGYFIMMNN